MKIRTRLFVAFLSTAAVSSLLATTFAIYSIHNRYESIATEANAASRRRAESVFYENLGDLTRKATFLSELTEIVTKLGSRDDLALAVESKAFFLSNINLIIFDTSKNLLYSSLNGGESNVDAGEHTRLPFFQEGWDPLMRESGILKVGEGIAFYAYSPVVELDTFELKGYLLLELPLNSVLVDEIKDKVKAEILVYQKDRETASTFVDQNGQRYFPRWPAEMPEGATRVEVLGGHFLMDSFSIRDYSNATVGRAYVGTDIEGIVRAKKIGIYSILTGFLLVVCIAILGSMLIGNRMSRPLMALSRGADAVAAGDFDVQLPVTSSDEIGNLGTVFNNMIESLKAQRQEMSQLRHFLQNIIDSMPSVLIGVDPDGRVTHWNMEATRVTGLPANEAQGQMLDTAFPGLKGQEEKVRKAISERSPQKSEKVSAIMAGMARHLDVMVYPLITNGIDGAVIRVDDVSQRVRIEEMMIQTEKMMSVGGLAAGMAHEINNPLGGVLQGAQNVIRRVSTQLPKNYEVARECGVDLEKVVAYLDKRDVIKLLGSIRECGERASHIVENMLSFSRRSESRRSPTRLDQLIDRTLELAANDYDLKKKYDFRHIKVVREYDRGLPEVPCVATEIQQVILNLVKNGAQAMFDRQGSAAPPQITVRLRRTDSGIQMEVEDNGPGMEEKIRKRVFEPFFTTKEAGIGTGLGLSVSYFIITNNHKGTMEVESSQGKGTSFIITLPLVPPPS